MGYMSDDCPHSYVVLSVGRSIMPCPSNQFSLPRGLSKSRVHLSWCVLWKGYCFSCNVGQWRPTQSPPLVEHILNVIANGLEIHWLTRYPWPTEITMDKGREFAREVSETLQNEYGIKRKIITSRNPQSNSMIERCHKTLHNMIRSAQIKDK